MPQKFLAAPVDRPLVFPSSALLSRSMVYSSSHLRSSFSVISYLLLSSHVLSVTLTVRFCQLRSFTLSSCLLVPLFIHLHTSRHTHTHTFCSHSFLSSVRFRILSFWFHIFIFLTRTFILPRSLFNLMLVYWFYTVLLVPSARVFSTLVTSVFFLSPRWS